MRKKSLQNEAPSPRGTTVSDLLDILKCCKVDAQVIISLNVEGVFGSAFRGVFPVTGVSSIPAKSRKFALDDYYVYPDPPTASVVSINCSFCLLNLDEEDY